MKTIEDRLRDVAVRVMGGNLELTNSTSFVNDLGADSLDMVDIIMGAEDEFNIEISDEDAENIHTFGDAINIVSRKVAED